MSDLKKNKTPLSRRSFINKLGLFLGIAALAEFSLVTFSMFRTKPKKNNKPLSHLFNAGEVSEFKPNSLSSFRSRQFYIYRAANGGFMAISSSCSHLGCAIYWEEQKEQFVCPCHSSHFDIKGNVLSAPASRALDYLPITIKNGSLYVDLDKKIRRQNFSNNQLVHA